MSNINYAAIDENFPVAGQDNDTQTFRDNFDTIKTSLRFAFEEVSDLQDNTARTDQDNDFNNKVITRAVMQYNKDAFFDGGNITSPISVDFENGYYQKFRFGSSTTMGFLNFPDDLADPPGVGKVILECSGTGTITLDLSGGITYKKSNWDISWGANSFNLNSTNDFLILEIWTYDSATYYIRNVGLFS